MVTPIGGGQAAPALLDPIALLAGVGVGVSSSVIPYVTDQLAMARLPRSTYALMVALLPAIATIIGIVVLAQIPTGIELAGLAFVISGVALHHQAPQPDSGAGGPVLGTLHPGVPGPLAILGSVMPIYEYRCSKGHAFEVRQGFSDAPVTTCEVCGATVARVFRPPAVHFKGSGFYNTDYGTRKRSREKETHEASKRESAKDSQSKASSDSGSKSGSDSSSSSSDSGGKSGADSGAKKSESRAPAGD